MDRWHKASVSANTGEKFQVNRSTVVEAMSKLYAQGLIEGKAGGGTKVRNNTWTLLSSNVSLDWNDYVKKGSYQPNFRMIQTINREEFNQDMIRLGTGLAFKRLAPCKANGDPD
jgi:GntR family transcriptional regulator of abcA and norABC